MNLNNRHAKLHKYMEKNDIKLSLVLNDQNQYYLSEYKAIIYSRQIIFAVTMDKTYLIVPGLEEDHAKAHSSVDEVFTYYEHPEKIEIGNSFMFFVDELLKKIPAGSSLGVEFQALPFNLAIWLQEKGYKLVDIGMEIKKTRYVKEQQEIDLMIEAGKLVSEAIRMSIENVKPGVTEMEMDQFGNGYLLEETPKRYPGATLDIFVMSPGGLARTNMPHVFSNTRKYEKQEIILHSRQVGLNGYRAEIERTLFLGEPTQKQKEVYKVMTEAQRALLDAIKPGMTAGEADKISRSIIQKAGYGVYSNHRSGHGIGIGLHEEPYLRFDSNLVLEEGMAFSIEPGIYIPELGGYRHSDTVILTSSGSIKITNYKRELEDLIL